MTQENKDPFEFDSAPPHTATTRTSLTKVRRHTIQRKAAVAVSTTATSSASESASASPISGAVKTRSARIGAKRLDAGTVGLADSNSGGVSKGKGNGKGVASPGKETTTEEKAKERPKERSKGPREGVDDDEDADNSFEFAANAALPPTPLGRKQGKQGDKRRSSSLVGAFKIVPTTAAKPIATADLVARLKDLHSQLNSFEQESVNLPSLTPTAKNLVSPSLVSHKDKAVKSLVACCLADILRLFAPDAPYSESELKSIFTLFINLLPLIADSSGPYFENYYYLLESLAVVKSIILLTDLNADNLIITLFKNIYGIVRPDFQKNVYGFLLQVLQCLIEESPTLNNEIVEMIIFQFDKPLNAMSRQLSIDLCNSVSDKLQRYICQHFGDLFYTSMKGGSRVREEDDEENEDVNGVSHADFKIAHKLILEMNSTCRGVLLNVIPLFEDQLKCEDEKVRELATDVLGKIFVDSGSRVAVVYPIIWKVWLERRNDKSAAIRILWVQFCTEVYRHHPELCADITEGLEQKFFDPDEKVRLAVMRAMRSLDLVSLVNVPKSLLLQIAERCKDKKMNVRAEALSTLANVFKLTYSDIVSDENQSAEKYGWIPGCILELVYLGDIETVIIVERVLHEDIFMYLTDDVLRTDRLLRIVGALTERQYKAFLSIIDRQATMMKDFMIYIEFCEKWNGGILDDDDGSAEANLHKVIIHLSAKFPDPKKAALNLQKFATNNENRVYKLFRGVMNENSDFKTITKSGKELMKRLDVNGGGLSDTFSVILRRVSLCIVGKSSISRLIEVAQSSPLRQRDEDGNLMSMANTTVDIDLARLAATAEGLIKKIAATFPKVFKSHLKEFLVLLGSGDESIVSDALEALSKFIKILPEDVVLNSDELEVITRYCMKGTIQDGKKAATILGLLKDSAPRNTIISNLQTILKTPSVIEKAINAIEEIIRRREQEEENGDDDNLDKDDDETSLSHLPTWLVVLGQFALYASKDYEEVQNIAAEVIMRDVLTKTYVADAHDDDTEWVNFENLHVEGVLKVLGLKVLVNRLRGLPEDVALTVARPVYKVLKNIVENEGELMATSNTCNAFKSHLRQAASISLLKLAKFGSCDSTIMTVIDRNRLMLTVQDPCWQIRDTFVERLRKYLQARSIPYRYIVILCMAALEPDDDIKIKAKTFLIRSMKMQKDYGASTLESIFPEFLHMVAHHPDFGMDDDEDVTLSAKYIQFYIEIVVSPENASFLYHSAAQLKTLVDLHSPTSDNIYHISDLTQFLIREHCKYQLWTLNSYPDVIPHKREFFKKMASVQEGNNNVKKSYLSKIWMEEMQNAVTVTKQKGRRKSAAGKAEKDRSMEMTEDEDEGDEEREDAEGAVGSTPVKKQRGAKTGGGNKRKATTGTLVTGRKKTRDEIDSSDDSDSELKSVGKNMTLEHTPAIRARSSRTATKKSKTYKDIGSGDEEDAAGSEMDIDEEENSDNEVTPKPNTAKRLKVVKSSKDAANEDNEENDGQEEVLHKKPLNRRVTTGEESTAKIRLHKKIEEKQNISVNKPSKKLDREEEEILLKNPVRKTRSEIAVTKSIPAVTGRNGKQAALMTNWEQQEEDDEEEEIPLIKPVRKTRIEISVTKASPGGKGKQTTAKVPSNSESNSSPESAETQV
ncbi:hypothetical protein HK100_001853 [Physocladia obscura]|uniref:Uncharacterized protein n=1 Tax=Physocladia obscura TaxID=109957 RepID=A0AAD5T9W3_9FUNG|nr:hypothetical protein HK100_001853 [Physocladia obscura]